MWKNDMQHKVSGAVDQGGRRFMHAFCGKAFDADGHGQRWQFSDCKEKQGGGAGNEKGSPASPVGIDGDIDEELDK